MKIKKESKEVLYSRDKLVYLSKINLHKLSLLAKKNKKKIIRLCTHFSKKDKVHQMFIVHPKNYFVSPHMHFQSESMTILKGMVDVIIFNKKGEIIKIIEMGPQTSKKIFYYKLPKNTIHSFLIKSKILIFYEVTQGPFKKSNMFHPIWAPKNATEIKSFQKKIRIKIKNFKENVKRP